MAKSVENLVGKRLVSRNMLLSLFGQSSPLLVGLVVIPLLVEGLGTDRFGVLTLAWLVIGYASVFDMGLGRALTQAISVRLGSDGGQEIPALTWTTITIMAILGALGTLIIGLSASWIAADVLRIPQNMVTETQNVIRLLALSLPAVIVTTGLRGVLEAYQRFGLLTALQVPLGIYSFLAPAIILPFSTNLSHITMVLVVGRSVAALAYVVACLRVVPRLATSFGFAGTHVKSLLAFGGWITISNLVAPLMLYMDRFLIAGILPITAVAYYATPYEIVTKLWIVPTAILAVMFPAFGSTFANDARRTVELYRQAMRWILVLLLPVSLVLVLLGRTGLEMWLNAEFAANSFQVVQILAVGIILHSLAMTSATLIQAAGRPSLTAKLHLLQLPLYAVLLWWLTTSYGIGGAALSWTLRAGITMLAMHVIAQKVVLAPKMKSGDST